MRQTTSFKLSIIGLAFGTIHFGLLVISVRISGLQCTEHVSISGNGGTNKVGMPGMTTTRRQPIRGTEHMTHHLHLRLQLDTSHLTSALSREMIDDLSRLPRCNFPKTPQREATTSRSWSVRIGFSPSLVQIKLDNVPFHSRLGFIGFIK